MEVYVCESVVLRLPCNVPDILLRRFGFRTHTWYRYDDQNDYFGDSTSAWMSFEEKEKARRKLERKEQKRAHRGKVRKYTVDLAGQRVLDGSSSSSDYSSDDDHETLIANQLREANSDPSNDPFFRGGGGGAGTGGGGGGDAAQPWPRRAGDGNEGEDFYANTTLRGRAKEIYKLIKKHKREGVLDSPPPLPSTAPQHGGADGNDKDAKKKKKRSALQHADDAGPMVADIDVSSSAAGVTSVPTGRRLWRGSERCLVVDQPFASLLVAGFRRFEGRGWSATYVPSPAMPSPHRLTHSLTHARTHARTHSLTH